MSDHLVVHGVAGLYAVNDFSFLVVGNTRNHCYGLHDISVKVFVGSVDALYAESLESLQYFLVNEAQIPS